MSEDSSTTSNPLDRMTGETSRHNTLGMSEEDYEDYQNKLVNEYKNNEDRTISGIAEREQKKGIKLYQDRLRRWITKADVRVRPQKEMARKMKGGGRPKNLYIRKDQAEMLEQFGNASGIARVALDILLGIPTSSIVLFLADYKSVVFIDGEDGVETYITSELTDMETKVIQTLTNKIQHHGLQYVEQFAVENELKYYGGE